MALHRSDTMSDIISLYQEIGGPYTMSDIISLYEEEFNDVETMSERQYSQAKLGEVLAHRSLTLEQVAISFEVDARDFFDARRPAWTWNNLQSLVLTSEFVAPTAGKKLCRLLQDAGKAVLCMPRLRTMCIWNGGKGLAGAFTYRRYLGPMILWRGTWHLELEPGMSKVWERVASEHARFLLSYESQLLQGSINSHGDAIHHLDLPPGVVEPTSLWQIRREGRRA